MSLFQNSVLNKYLRGLESEKVNEAYERFTSHFHNPTIQENIRNSKEEQYQGEFLIDLFVNIFGYVKNPTPNFNLTTELKNVKDSKKTDGAILKGEKALAVIELKGTNTTDLSKVETQAFGYKNNQTGCNYVITSNFEKLRFYIDNAVDFEEFNLFQLTKERFDILWLCLSSEYLLKDIPKKIKDESLTQEEKITKELYKDYASFRNEVFESIQKENPEYDKLTLFKKTQKLLDRFLFIFFAEDRLLLPPNSIRSIVNQWTDLRDKYDEYFTLYDRFQKYFDYMNTGHKGQQHEIFAYNGGLFAPDEVLDNIKINDDLLFKHTVNLSNYDFESEVSVNILGHIFEHSLNDIDEIQAEIQGISSDQSKTKRKKDGVFYTPKYVTKYIVDNTVGKLCEEKKTELDIQEAEYEKERKGRQKATLKKLTQKLEDYRKWLLQITICDPACGSGAFLNQALEFLIAEHQYIDELQAKLFGDAMILSEVENSILENNLFGVDINEESVEIAKLSLWLRTAQKGRKLTSLNNNIKCGNSIIDEPAIAGEKAFNWQNEFSEVFANGGFDIIIGNPPYAGRTSFISDIEKKFIRDNYKTSEGRFELYQLFIERSIVFTKNENGYISLITPQTWLSIIQATKLRKEVLKNNELFEIIFLGKDIFPDASVDTVIFIISKGKKNNYINYLNSSNLINTDLQNTEIQYSEINTSDFIIPSSSNNEYSSIEKKINNGSVNLEKIGEWSDGVIVAGKAKEFAFSYEKTDESFFPMLIGRDVERYSMHWSGKYCCRDKNLIEEHNPSAYRLREERMFKRRKILIRKTGNSIVSTIDDSKYYYEQSLFSFGINDQSEFKLEFIQSILNSNLANFLQKMNSFSMKDTFPQIRIHWLKDFPIKKISVKNQQLFIDKTHFMLQQSNELLDKSNSFTSLLKSKYSLEKISKKLQNWYELKFGDFLKELKKQKIQFSLNEEADWMQYFNEQKVKAQTLKTEIDKTDKEINQIVYELYGLTEVEIKIVEEATA
jgi:type I restriction-modification system DNA methylase subunit